MEIRGSLLSDHFIMSMLVSINSTGHFALLLNVEPKQSLFYACFLRVITKRKAYHCQVMPVQFQMPRRTGRSYHWAIAALQYHKWWAGDGNIVCSNRCIYRKSGCCVHFLNREWHFFSMCNICNWIVYSMSICKLRHAYKEKLSSLILILFLPCISVIRL